MSMPRSCSARSRSVRSRGDVHDDFGEVGQPLICGTSWGALAPPRRPVGRQRPAGTDSRSRGREMKPMPWVCQS